MDTSRNKSFGKNKFYNIKKGKKYGNFFFFLPTIMISPKKFLHWDLVMFSIFLGWGNYFIQFNIFEIVKDSSIEIYRENMQTLAQFLKANHMTIIDLQATLSYLNKNSYLIQLIKNSKLDHPYIKTIFLNHFQSQPFIKNNKTA